MTGRPDRFGLVRDDQGEPVMEEKTDRWGRVTYVFIWEAPEQCPAAPCREPHGPEQRHYDPECPFTHSHTGSWCGHGCGTETERRRAAR